VALQTAEERILHLTLGGAAVHRCDDPFVSIPALAPGGNKKQFKEMPGWSIHPEQNIPLPHTRKHLA
jgi:hypothetical protein